MRKIIVFIYKVCSLVYARAFVYCTSIITYILLYFNGIKIVGGVKSSGVPLLHLSRRASCLIGRGLTMGNWTSLNASGISAKCKIEVRNEAVLEIGNNVGITSTTIMCFDHISIGDNTKIGVGTHIYDTDFHNIDPISRLDGDNPSTVKTSPIHIGNNVFIGAYSIILKGVTIGDNAVVGAGSVVTKNIPPNEVWGGNPAKFLKNL